MVKKDSENFVNHELIWIFSLLIVKNTVFYKQVFPNYINDFSRVIHKMKDLVINCSHFTLLCVGKHVFVTVMYVYNKFLWPVCIKIIRCYVHYVLQLLWLPNAIALYNKHINTFYYVIQKYLLCASLMPEKPSKIIIIII